MMASILAATGLGICLVLIVRLLLTKPQQSRFDAKARRLWQAFKHEAVGLWHWRGRRQTAQQAATDAINRASKRAGRQPRQDDGVWKGNVYESKNFRKPRKPH